MGIVCLMSKGQVSCRHLSEDTIAQSEANQEFLAADEPTKSNLLKYLLNAYHRVAAENDRLKEEYAQLGSVVKFLTEGKLRELKFNKLLFYVFV